MSTAPHAFRPQPPRADQAESRGVGSEEESAVQGSGHAAGSPQVSAVQEAAALGADEFDLSTAQADVGAIAAVEAPGRGKPGAPYRRSLMDRIDAFGSRLAARNNFWQRLASLFWLPYAFKSGIRMKRIDANTFSAILPFRRFNRNWYNAMAGAALLANSEVASGMYVFGICGGEYEVVCKNLEYKFLRPCLGPAVYRIAPREDVEALAAQNAEFNVTLDLDILQQIGKPGSRERRVGKCVVTFHVTPKAHQKAKGRKI